MQQRMLCTECVPLDYILLEQEAPVRNIVEARAAHGYTSKYDRQLSRLNNGKISTNKDGFRVIDTDRGNLPCVIELEAGFKPNELLDLIDGMEEIYYTLTTRSFYDDNAQISIWKIGKSK